MKLARWHIWGAGLAVILLLGLWFRPDHRPGPTHHPPHEVPDASHDHVPLLAPGTPPLPSAASDPDCVTCPPRSSLSEKRDAISEEEKDECWNLLLTAAEQGIPDPDTSHLRDCNETPIFHAYKAEQIQALVDAGADLNIHGQYGHTPLYRQLHRAVVRPTEDTHAVIQAMLEAGADPWMSNVDGELPYDVARKMNMSGTTRVRGEEFLKAKLEEHGITEAQAFAERPEFAKAMEQMRAAPGIASRTIVSIMDAMKRTDPTRNQQ